MSELLIHPFAPIYDNDSRVLILGSFPSVKSREMSFYYAHKNNRFWPVMSLLFNEEIKDRRKFCYDHHIALWDVIYSCKINKSDDASISEVTVNDIKGMVEKTAVRTVFTTGTKASYLYKKHVFLDIEHISLPSTSSANASMSLFSLAEKYRVIKRKLYETS